MGSASLVNTNKRREENRKKIPRIQLMRINFVRTNDLAKVPTRGSEYAAGYDLYAATSYDAIIEPHKTVKFDTGLRMELPVGTFGAIYSRSGLAIKQNLIIRNDTDIVIRNGVGIIDEDYRGNIIVALYNDSDINQIVPAGSRIAQLVITPYITVDFVEVDKLSETERGEGGFGSTGV